jgi:thiol:disulfide interchange protein DsbG
MNSLRHLPRTLLRHTRVVALATPLLSACIAPAVWAQDRPAVLDTLAKKGVTVVGPLPSASGLPAWAAHVGQRPVALYATPDGKHLIVGTLLDAKGDDADGAALDHAVGGAMGASAWSRLQQSHWIADGTPKAPRTVYVFTDPNCPYCNRFWADARPWVDAGKVQLRHVMVGILTPTSAGKAAALLKSSDPAAALATYERNQVGPTAKAMEAGRPRPLDDAGLKPLAAIPPTTQAQLDANAALMANLGLQATPAMAWRDAAGALKTRTGAPSSALSEVLGPR